MVKGGAAATPAPAKKPVEESVAPARASSVMHISHNTLTDPEDRFTMPAIFLFDSYLLLSSD